MPKLTAGAIIINNLTNPESILLTKRNIPPFKGQWCFPGGHVDKFEKAENAIIREVKEETGLGFYPEFLNYFDEIFADKQIHNLVLMFYGTVTGEIEIQETEVAEIKWFPIKEALKIDLAFGHNQVLEYFMKFNLKNKTC